jgi:hypothetical protein
MNRVYFDPNSPFTRDLLRSLTATVPAQPDETDAEYAERFAAATTAWADLRALDTVEQMLAAHYAALDCLTRAAETDDSTKAERLRRSYATMTRTMRDLMRLLDRHQQRPTDTEAPPSRGECNALPHTKRETRRRAEERPGQNDR